MLVAEVRSYLPSEMYLPNHLPEVRFEVDVESPTDEQPGATPFNRWHPDIPAAVEAEPRETIRLDWRSSDSSVLVDGRVRRNCLAD